MKLDYNIRYEVELMYAKSQAPAFIIDKIFNIFHAQVFFLTAYHCLTLPKEHIRRKRSAEQNMYLFNKTIQLTRIHVHKKSIS